MSYAEESETAPLGYVTYEARAVWYGMMRQESPHRHPQPTKQLFDFWMNLRVY